MFAKILKCVLSKEFIENKSTEWINILSKIIEQYYNSPHTALVNITPNDAISDPKKRMHGMHLNILKARDNGFAADLKAGTQHNSGKTQRVDGVMRSMWFSQQVVRQ